MASYDGKGATGKVYKEMRRGQWAAVKKVPGDLVTRHDMDREYEIYKRAQHPNIVKLVERPVLCYNYMWDISMEYIFGENLEKIMFHPRRSSIQLTPAITSKIITGMCEGLFHLHNNDIVHQDLKPDNIMVESGTYRAVIIDMGFAKFYRNGLNSAQDRGNLAYAAPEIRGQPYAERDHRSDVWAMGKIIAELLIGYRIPHMYLNPAHIQDTLRGNVYCDVVSRMLDGSPIPRATMAQVIGEIRTAGRVAGERQSVSIPSSMQVQQHHHSRERGGALSMFMRSLDLPPHFHLPDPLPHNTTIRVNHVRPHQSGRGATATQGELRIRGGRLEEGWWVTFSDDDEDSYALTYPDY